MKSTVVFSCCARLAIMVVLLLTGITAVAWQGSALQQVQGTFGAPQKPASHIITIKDLKYEPETLTVHPGDTVVWQNHDIVVHTVTARNKSFDSPRIKPGASWSMTVRSSRGTQDYTCVPHPNMKGRLVIQ
jgi:plastocyanin